MTHFTIFSSQLLPCCPPCGTVAIKPTADGYPAARRFAKARRQASLALSRGKSVPRRLPTPAAAQGRCVEQDATLDFMDFITNFRYEVAQPVNSDLN